MAHEKPGYLPPKEIQKGIQLCLQNTNDILEECGLLIENKKLARALAFSISALEEIGKISVLRSINRLPKNKNKLLSIEWTRYFDHQHKSGLGFFNTVSDENRKTIDSVMLSALLVREQAAITEDIRQMAIYTSYSTKKKMWYSPRDLDNNIVFEYMNLAKESYKRITKMQELGLFDTDVLQLEKDMYKELFDDVPDEKYNEDTLRRLAQLSREKAKQFLDKLIEMGKIAESDVHFIE
jgi:AbiV family abortive infection protein